MNKIWVNCKMAGRVCSSPARLRSTAASCRVHCSVCVCLYIYVYARRMLFLFYQFTFTSSVESICRFVIIIIIGLDRDAVRLAAERSPDRSHSPSPSLLCKYYCNTYYIIIIFKCMTQNKVITFTNFCDRHVTVVARRNFIFKASFFIICSCILRAGAYVQLTVELRSKTVFVARFARST